MTRAVTQTRLRVVLATGGTGGHIYPAISTAKALLALGLEVAFIGQQRGLEARVVPAEGLPFYGVRAGKWHRGRPDPREALRAALGLKDAARLLRRLEPTLVVGFGGFASFPALAAARFLGLPYALHEQNTYPGKVVRWFAKGARFVAAASSDVATHLPVAVEVTGVPVREVRVAKRLARQKLNLPETGPVTLVMGGSQGSFVLNRAVPDAFEALPESVKADLNVLQSSGPAHLGPTRQRVSGLPGYRVDGYLDSVLAWSAADLGITRAGNGTLAEAAFYGVPLVMVPLPSAAENHQLHNARAVQAAGAGVVVEEHELDRLPNAWQGLLDPQVRAEAGRRAQHRSPEGAAERLAELIAHTAQRVAATSPRTGRSTSLETI